MSHAVQTPLSEFVAAPKFPCVMAKAVFNTGYVSQHVFTDGEPDQVAPQLVQEILVFIENYRKNPKKLSSFIVSFDHPSLTKFDDFETFFWKLLESVDALDKKHHAPDPRVSNSPHSPHFSFSVGGEAFFLLLLHPKNPRHARRFAQPTIVFNAHQQFEDLRKKGLFQKVRDLIRKRDRALQGFINPMLNDYGQISEVFQYTGRDYKEVSRCPFHRAVGFLKHFTSAKANIRLNA